MARTTEHREGSATVRVIYRIDKTLKDGSHPFWLRITKDRKSRYVATGLSLNLKYWNDQYTGYREAIRKSYPEAYRKELIGKLTEWETKYSHAAETLAGADEVHDAKAIASKAIEGRQQARKYTVLDYLTEQITTMQRIGKVGYCGVYQDLKNQLTEFLKTERAAFGYGKTDLRFDEITVRFCNGFEVFFRERGNADTSLSVRFRTLRTLYNRAIAEGVAKAENYPFARNVAEKHKFSVGKFDTKTRKRAITRDEVRRIETFVPTGTATGQYAGIKNQFEVERLQRAKDVFLFSFYVGGMNFVDLSQLRWRNLSTDSDGKPRINYTRQKTNGLFSLRLLPPALAIIEQYRAFTHHNGAPTGPDSYIFPILSTEAHKTPNQIKYRLTKILGQVNQDLKQLGQQLGIATPLTTYVARHSFATSLRRSGIADAVTGQLMGHKDTRQTSIYLDEFDSTVADAAFDSLL
jgi:integrase